MTSSGQMKIHDNNAVWVSTKAIGIDVRNTTTGISDATIVKRSTGGGIVRREQPSRFATYSA